MLRVAGSTAMAKDHMPKRVLGVRVPKRVRRGRIGEALGSEIGQEVTAEAIVALAGLLIVQAGRADSGLRRRLLPALAAGAEAFAAAVKRGPSERA